MSRIRTVLLIAGCTFLLAADGCSSGFDYGTTGTVTGRLTLEGKTMSPGHAVSFMDPQKGFLAYGKTDKEGRYQVNSWNEGKLPIGKYEVMIAPPPLEAPKKELTPEERFDHPEMEVAKMEFPKRYRETSTSGLMFEIKAGPNLIDIDLKKKPTK
ncbi:MAG TPA: hypothetical protein VM452_01405 [Caulifigura sp.]|nr:hypothetical protein [Caulifigura sp.]